MKSCSKTEQWVHRKHHQSTSLNMLGSWDLLFCHMLVLYVLDQVTWGGGAGPRKEAGVIRGTWGSGSGYFKTGLDVLQYLNSHHKTRWHTCQTQPRFHKREAIAQRVALMLWIKEAPFLFSTAAEVPVFCKFSSKPHKGPWKPSKAMPAAANTHKTLCN